MKRAVMSKKKSFFFLFVFSIMTCLLLFNNENILADSVLDEAYSLSVENCPRDACTDCAKRITYALAKKYDITNPRELQDIYNAALDGCD
jgi:hypothetical protein